MQRNVLTTPSSFHLQIVSCGEDQKICIWDFSHGIDTNFVTL
jgi:hypothetical protein